MFFERITSFLCFASVCQYRVTKCFETLMEDLLKALDGGCTLYFTRCFFTELVNNLSTWKWNYSTSPFVLRSTSLFFQQIGTFPVSSTSLKVWWNVVRCLWQFRRSPPLWAKPPQAGRLASEVSLELKQTRNPSVFPGCVVMAFILEQHLQMFPLFWLLVSTGNSQYT